MFVELTYKADGKAVLINMASFDMFIQWLTDVI